MWATGTLTCLNHRSRLCLVVDMLGSGATEAQVVRALRAMKLRFGQLTDSQLSQLRALWLAHKDDPDLPVLAAAQLPGGWTSQNIQRLLKKHGMGEANIGGWASTDIALCML